MIAFYSVKGGSGATVAACARAVLLSADRPVTLIDMAGDVATALGQPPVEPGQCRAITPSLEVVSWESMDGTDPEGVGRFYSTRMVVVDGGTNPTGWRRDVLASAQELVLVTRACFLALRRAQSFPLRPTAVLLVEEPERVLRASDIQECLGVPMISVSLDPAIAQRVDAGTMAVAKAARLRAYQQLGRASAGRT